MLLIAGLTVLVGLAMAAARPQVAAAGSASVSAYRGLGTWVDMYDAAAWNDPAAAVADMALHGVRTLYIETANYHNPATASLFKPAALAVFIQECHARKMKIVAWYLPGFKDLDKDYKRSMAAIDFRTSDGQKFDSFALDIEDSHVKPASTRSARLKTLSARIREAVGNELSPRRHHPVAGRHEDQRELLAGLPLQGRRRRLRRDRADGLLHLSRRRLRARLQRDPREREHRARADRPTDDPHPRDRRRSRTSRRAARPLGYVRALRETGCLGGSMYDWATTNDADWRPLANVRFNKVQTPALPQGRRLRGASGQLPRRHLAPQGGLLPGAGQSGESDPALPPLGRADRRGQAGRELAGRRRAGPPVPRGSGAACGPSPSPRAC